MPSRRHRLLSLLRLRIGASLRQELLRHAAILAGGHAVGMAIGLAAAPLLCRIYSPEAFGVFTVFIVAASALAAVATGRYEQAIPLPRSRRRAQGLVVLSAGLLIAVSLAITVALVVANLTASRSDALPLGWWLPPAVLTFAVYQVMSAWTVRASLFTALARMRIVYAVVSVLVQFAVPLFHMAGPEGLITGQIVGMGMASLWAAAAARDSLAGKNWPGWRYLIGVAGRYRDYPRMDMPASLLNTAAVHGPTVLVAACFGPMAAGCYALAHRLLTSPMTLLSHSMSRAYYNQAARLVLGDAGQMRQLFFRTLRQVMLLAAPPLALGAIIAPLSFAALFGSQWYDAGVFFSLLAPMVLAYLVAIVVGPTFDVLGRQDLRLVREATITGLIVVGILVPYLAGSSATVAVAAASLLATLGYAMSLLLARRALDTHAQRSNLPSSLPTKRAA